MPFTEILPHSISAFILGKKETDLGFYSMISSQQERKRLMQKKRRDNSSVLILH